MRYSSSNILSLAPKALQEELSSKNLNNTEDERFLKYHPLVNLLIMSIGPFLTQFGMSFLDSIDLLIISHRFKKHPDAYAVQIIGLGFFVQQICIYIGMFLQQAIMVRVSSLIGEGKRKEAGQLTVDIYRISIISNVIGSIIVTFIARPLMIFSGCTHELIEPCTLLIISSIAGIPFTSIFHISTGFLQAIGKTVANGLIHLAANCLQTFIITPILQFLIKIDVTLSNISQPIAQSILGLIVFHFTFQQKYSLKPTFSMWFNKFNPETWKSLVMSLSMIPVWIYDLLPTSLILRFMTSSSASESFKTDVIGVYTVLQKIFLIGNALPMALSVGFLTAATFCLSQNNYKRMITTLNYALLLNFIFYVIFIPITIFEPVKIMQLFGISSPSQLEIAKKMVPIPMYTFAVGMICCFLVNFFVAVNKTLYSNIVAFFQLISLCVASKIIAVIYPDDPVKQMFSYTISDLSTTVLTLILFIITFVPLFKKSKLPTVQLFTENQENK